ncbi:hybrid sensor histidine kinase/response regulator [Anaerolineales bacterium]
MNHEELLKIFAEEVQEYLQLLNDGLLKVEMQNAEEQAHLLKELNRYAHSMKGAARAVGFGNIETISHHMEEIFHLTIHDGYAITPDIADTLYDGLDLIENTIHGNEVDGEIVNDVIAQFESIVLKARTPNTPKPYTDTSREMPAITLTEGVDKAPEIADMRTTREIRIQEDMDDILPTMVLKSVDESMPVAISKLDYLMAEASELLILRMQGEEREHLLNQIQGQVTRWQREWRSVRAAYIRLMRRLQDENAGELAILLRFMESNQRYLHNTSRQLNQLSQHLKQDHLHIGTVADNLQHDVANLRMMPFETILNGFHRMVRDIARDLNKQIHFDITGAGVEVDKSVLTALRDPLTHLIRNALDHGIEASIEERVKAGKSPVGRIGIQIEQRGGEISIEIFDDGRGLDVDKIRNKAVEHGILSETEAAQASPDELKLLIFYSGFSTSSTVTTLSGRGLGMDIVRERVESLRGRIHIYSDWGKGSRVEIRVPVSLTRQRCIVLRVGKHDFAIPSVMVSRMELIRRSQIFTSEGKEMVHINQQPMPLLSLGSMLNIYSKPKEDELVRVLAIHSADRAIAIEVDELKIEVELVLKPLGPELANTPYIAGGAILGSGEVLIILDGNELVRHTTGTSLPRRSAAVRATQSTPAVQILRALVVDDSITTRTLEKNILEAIGINVQTAINGEEAWQIILENEFDVIISDVEMPKLNGIELVQRIRAHKQLNHLPIILLTSLSKPEQREAGLKAGANAYLVKSQFDQQILLETIKAVL